MSSRTQELHTVTKDEPWGDGGQGCRGLPEAEDYQKPAVYRPPSSYHEPSSPYYPNRPIRGRNVDFGGSNAESNKDEEKESAAPEKTVSGASRCSRIGSVCHRMLLHIK